MHSANMHTLSTSVNANINASNLLAISYNCHGLYIEHAYTGLHMSVGKMYPDRFCIRQDIRKTYCTWIMMRGDLTLYGHKHGV